MGYMEIKWNK